MRLRTDDDIYRARLVYLGPPGYTLPVHLPYAQYGLFMLLVPLYMFIHWLITLHGRALPGLGDRAGHRDHVVHLPARRPRPAGPDGHPHRADRLAAHPGAGRRAARPAPGRQPDPDPGGAGMTGPRRSVRRTTRIEAVA